MSLFVLTGMAHLLVTLLVGNDNSGFESRAGDTKTLVNLKALAAEVQRAVSVLGF